MSDKEKRFSEIKFETKQPLSNQNIGLLKRFIESETDPIIKQLDASPTDIDNSTLEQTLIMRQALSVLEKMNLYSREKSFVEFAKDANGSIAGFMILAVDENNEVKETFLGVATKYKRIGVGLELVSSAHRVLKQAGIKSYKVGLWTASRGIYDKLVEAGSITLTPIIETQISASPQTSNQFFVHLNTND